MNKLSQQGAGQPETKDPVARAPDATLLCGCPLPGSCLLLLILLVGVREHGAGVCVGVHAGGCGHSNDLVDAMFFPREPRGARSTSGQQPAKTYTNKRECRPFFKFNVVVKSVLGDIRGPFRIGLRRPRGARGASVCMQACRYVCMYVTYVCM